MEPIEERRKAMIKRDGEERRKALQPNVWGNGELPNVPWEELLAQDGIERDATYPNMWRIRTRCGLSDMVNLARAKDAIR